MPRHSKIYVDLVPILEKGLSDYRDDVRARRYPGQACELVAFAGESRKSSASEHETSMPSRPLKYFHFASHGGTTVARLGFSGELGYELLVPSAEGPRLRQAVLSWEGRRYSLSAHTAA